MGVLPWCLAPNGIRGERQRKGDKVELRCCQLRLATSGPNSGETGALSRHRSHSPFTPLSLSTHPFISNSFFSHFIVLPFIPSPRLNAPAVSWQHSMMQERWLVFFQGFLFFFCLNQNGIRKSCNQTSNTLDLCYFPFVIGILSSFCETERTFGENLEEIWPLYTFFLIISAKLSCSFQQINLNKA